jgi:hypothetical protein
LELLHVMVLGLRGVVGDMIEAAVEAEPGMTLARYPAALDPAMAIRVADLDVLVVGSPGGELPRTWHDMLLRDPGLRVVAVDPERGTSVLYEMSPRAVQLGDVAPADIVAAIGRLPKVRVRARD